MANSDWHCKEFVRGALLSAATALVFFAGFVVFALLVPADRQAVRQHIASAVEQGAFNQQFAYGPFGRIVWPRHTLDCALAGMMLAPPEGRLIDAISNRYIKPNVAWHDARVPETLDCQAMARAFPALGAGYGDVQFEPTDRYILGVRVIGEALLSVMPFEWVMRTLRDAAFALLGLLGGLAAWKMRTGPDAESRRVAMAYLIMALCLALLYGVHYFDATLYFAPPDCTHFAFIIVSLLLPLASMRPAALAVYAASYGSLIAIFESLTGGIPFALAMMPLLLALGFQGTRREYLIRLFLLWGAFCIAVVTCFALKKGVSIAFLNDQESFTSLLLYRMYGAPMEASGTRLTLGYLLTAYRRWSGLIAFGSANGGTALVLIALAVITVQTWRAGWARMSPMVLACWLGIAALLVWAAAFLNHTAVHPYFMARLLIIPVIGAAVIVTMELLQPRGTQAAKADRSNAA